MADSNELRAKMILKDIYARHGIDPAMPLEEQLNAVQMSAAMQGNTQSAWSNPEERARARAEYAAKGRNDREKEQRWQESAYLLDPDTYQYQQNAGRDIDFLLAMDQASRRDPDAARSAAAVGAAGGTSAYAQTPQSGVAEALAYWDSSNNSPLFRESLTTSNYQSQSPLLMGLLNATTNPDVPAGNYMNFSEVIPDWLRMWGSGEAGSSGEAYEAAQAKRMATNRYRLSSPSPVLDLPDGADVVAKDNRIRELRELTQKADIPTASQRWARTAGFVPPGWLTDSLDFATSWLDPTAAIPIGGIAGGAAKVGMKGAKVAGSGWVRPLLANLAKGGVSGAASDMGVEQAIGHGIGGVTGGRPERSWKEWAIGDLSPNQKSEEEVAASRQARTQLYDQLKDDDRVSRADEEAYKGLGLRVHVQYPYR